MNDRKTVDLEDGWSHMQVGVYCDLHMHIGVCCFALQRRHFGLCKTSFTPQTGITKLKKLLEGENESSFNAEQYMMLYT